MPEGVGIALALKSGRGEVISLNLSDYFSRNFNMDKGIYTALSGAIARSNEIDILANNLANVNTVGFKGDNGTFNEYLQELRRPDSVEALGQELMALTMFDGRPVGDKSFVEMDSIYTDFSQGLIRKTDRELDVAIEGKGYFKVSTPMGTRYTRQGNFSLQKDGTLVTSDGRPVLSKGQEAKIVLGSAPVHIDAEGGIYQNGEKVAEIAIQEFHEDQWLEKIGNGYFRNADQKNLKDAQNTRLIQGSIEGSNVNPVREMTKMIQATRAYEMHMQSIKSFQQIDRQGAVDMARD